MHRAQKGLGAGLVPEPQAGESVLGGLGGFHLGRRHARTGETGVSLRSSGGSCALPIGYRHAEPDTIAGITETPTFIDGATSSVASIR